MPTARLERYVRARKSRQASGCKPRCCCSPMAAPRVWRDLLIEAGLENINWGDVLDSHINAADG